MDDNAPLSPHDLAGLLLRLGLDPREDSLAIAVSGGADSMALAMLAVDALPKAEFLTFDHGLRPESGADAAQVRDWLGARGCRVKVMRWTGDKPEAGIQKAAREARYSALESHCMKRDIRYLLLAHHLEDQAETFLLRLIRGSGVDGLAAMSPISPALVIRGGPLHIRPLLDVPKARLRATLQAMGQAWLEDPSNLDTSYTRIKVRNLLNETQIEGFDAVRLAATAKRMGRARRALEIVTDDLIHTLHKSAPEAYATLDAARLAKASDELALRALARLLMHYGGRIYPPRLEGLERLYRELCQDKFEGATYAGCCIMPHDDGEKICILRELSGIEERLALVPGKSEIWDNRYRVCVAKGEGLEVARLGDDGWRQLVGVWSAARGIDAPHPARLVLPCLWRDDVVVAVPALGFGLGVEFSADFSPRSPLFVSHEAKIQGLAD